MSEITNDVMLVEVARAIDKIDGFGRTNMVKWGEHNEWAITYDNRHDTWTAYHYGAIIAVFERDKYAKWTLVEVGSLHFDNRVEVVNSMCNWFGTESIAMRDGGHMQMVPRCKD